MVEIFGADSTLRSTVTDLFTRSNAGVITLGAALTLYASSRGFIAVVRALDVTYGHEHRRRWLATRVVGFTMTIVTVVVGRAGGGDGRRRSAARRRAGRPPSSSDGGPGSPRPGSGSAGRWWRASWWCGPPPSTASRPSGRRAGAASCRARRIATAWWLVASTGFRLYLGLASSGMNTVFGLLGGALSLLFWLYLLSMGLLVGAVCNSLIARRRDGEPPAGEQATPAA